MNIREIIIYSHYGQIRRISFNLSGLSIITGRSSTGKSALSDIVEYCMGRSSFNIPEGPIRDKVAWYAVIFQFANEQVFIAKPAPAPNAASCSRAMIRRGYTIEPPPLDVLESNTDDDTVVSLLSELLGIPANRTEVSNEQSRASYAATIKHCIFYLFQKQALIANKDQLFYRQNEQYMPQAIKDTIPILLGVAPNDRLELDTKLRNARRDLRILQKNFSEAEQVREQFNTRALGLLSEAKQVGILNRGQNPETMEDALQILSEIIKWKPVLVPDEDTRQIADLENAIATLRNERTALYRTLRAARLFADKEDGFTSEAKEQKSRLESINALPRQSETGEWQWPFTPKDLDFENPIAKYLIQELESLNKEISTVAGERPQLNEYILKLENQLSELKQRIRSQEEALAAAIAANVAIAEMGNRHAAAARIVGRISLFLETYLPDDELTVHNKKIIELQALVKRLESELGADDSGDRLASIINIISIQMNQFIRELEAEFAEYPFRLDLNNLTVVADRPDRPVPMNKTGGAANHLAYHLSALLALHHFTTNHRRPMPSFLFLDQPTQVYFPSEDVYKQASGLIEATERDSDIEKVRKLFSILYRFTTKESPGFQIIITEHANLRDDWFQESMIETPWTKPPALVPDDWESK